MHAVKDKVQRYADSMQAAIDAAYAEDGAEDAVDAFMAAGLRQLDSVERIDSQVCYAHSLSRTNKSLHRRAWQEQLTLGRCTIKFKVDTGSDVTIISLRHLLDAGFSLNDLSPTEFTIESFSRHVLTPLGVLRQKLVHHGRAVHATIFVLSECPRPLLGLSEGEDLGFFQRSPTAVDSVTLPVALTTGLGKFPELIHLSVDPDVAPQKDAPRKVAFSLRDKVKRELLRMVQVGVLVPQSAPTDWISPMLVRHKKDGELRLCMDPRKLNVALRREHFPLPEMDDVLSRIGKAKFFSCLDLNMGFWQLPLDPASSILCTMATPFGRFSHLRLPFGIAPAPEIFHRVVSFSLEGLPGVISYIDDILVFADTQDEHDRRLAAVLTRLQNRHFTVNEKKCVLGQREVVFLGYHIRDGTVRPNPAKVAALADMPPPKDKADLRRLMGLLTYFSPFLPNFSHLSEPLRRLQGADTAWEWSAEQEQVLRGLVNHLVQAPVLRIFDPLLPTILASDASGIGLGAVLLQRNMPIAYASRTLTKAERNYAAIEKEFLGILFGLERFHFYTFGRPIQDADSDASTDARPQPRPKSKSAKSDALVVTRFFADPEHTSDSDDSCQSAPDDSRATLHRNRLQRQRELDRVRLDVEREQLSLASVSLSHRNSGLGGPSSAARDPALVAVPPSGATGGRSKIFVNSARRRPSPPQRPSHPDNRVASHADSTLSRRKRSSPDDRVARAPRCLPDSGRAPRHHSSSRPRSSSGARSHQLPDHEPHSTRPVRRHFPARAAAETVAAGHRRRHSPEHCEPSPRPS